MRNISIPTCARTGSQERLIVARIRRSTGKKSEFLVTEVALLIPYRQSALPNTFRENPALTHPIG
jgi:hypothetical protein